MIMSNKRKPVTKTIIHGIATGVPENFLSQKDYVSALEEKEPVLNSIDKKKLESLFMHTQIEKRHFSKSYNVFNDLTIEEREKAFTKGIHID